MCFGGIDLVGLGSLWFDILVGLKYLICFHWAQVLAGLVIVTGRAQTL